MLNNIEYLRIRYINANAGAHGGHDNDAVKILSMLFHQAELAAINALGANGAPFRGVANAVGDNITAESPLGRALGRAATYRPEQHADDQARATEITDILTPLVRRARRQPQAGEAAIFPNAYSAPRFTQDKNAANALNQAWVALVQAAQVPFDALDIDAEANIATRRQNVLNAIAGIAGLAIANADEEAIYRGLLEQKSGLLQTAMQAAQTAFDALDLDNEANIAARHANAQQALDNFADAGGLAGPALEHYEQLLTAKVAALRASMDNAELRVGGHDFGNEQDLQVRLQSIQMAIAGVGHGVVIADAIERDHYVQALRKEAVDTRVDIVLGPNAGAEKAQTILARAQAANNADAVAALNIADAEERALYQASLTQLIQAIGQGIAQAQTRFDGLHLDDQDLQARDQAIDTAIAGIGALGLARTEHTRYRELLQDKKHDTVARLRYAGHQFEQNLEDVKATFEAIRLASEADHSAIAAGEREIYEGLLGEARHSVEILASVDRKVAEISTLIQDLSAKVADADKALNETARKTSAEAAGQQLTLGVDQIGAARIAIHNLQGVQDMALSLFAKAKASFRSRDLGRSDAIGIQLSNIQSLGLLASTHTQTVMAAVEKALDHVKAAEEAQIGAESLAEVEKLIAEILASEKEANESVQAAQARVTEATPRATTGTARESLGNASHFMLQAQIALGNLQAAKTMADKAKTDVSQITGIGLKWIKLNMESLIEGVRGNVSKVKQSLAMVNEHLSAVPQTPTSVAALMDQSANLLGQQVSMLQSQLAQFAQGMGTQVPTIQPTMLTQLSGVVATSGAGSSQTAPVLGQQNAQAQAIMEQLRLSGSL